MSESSKSETETGTLDPIAQFELEREQGITAQGENARLLAARDEFLLHSFLSKYSYNFSWMSRPIIQYPQDIVAFQELVWAVKPDLIIETGIAHGGSLIMNASYLAMIDYCEAATRGCTLEPKRSGRKVLGIDIDIRAHNRAAIDAHPMRHMIHMLEGSSIDKGVVEQVHSFAKDYKRVLVSLDSNHTHEHVLEELNAYARLTSKGSYCVVLDTLVEDLPSGTVPNRPWDKGNNPKTAVHSFLEQLSEQPQTGADGETLEFEVDLMRDAQLLISVGPSGYLHRI